MDQIIKRPKHFELHEKDYQRTKAAFPFIFKEQRVCKGDIYVVDDNRRILQLTEKQARSLQNDGRPWDFKSFYAEYACFMDRIAEVEPRDRDYVLVFEVTPEDFDALAENLGFASKALVAEP